MMQRYKPLLSPSEKTAPVINAIMISISSGNWVRSQTVASEMPSPPLLCVARLVLEMY